jgi:hypothetical protein
MTMKKVTTFFTTVDHLQRMQIQSYCLQVVEYK